MGIVPNRPTWVTFLLLLVACGSDSPSSGQLQQGPTASLRYLGAPVYEVGLQNLNTSTEVTLPIMNKGRVRATEITGSFNLSIAFAYQGGAFPGTTGTCTDTLEPQEECTLVVVFSPPSAAKFETALNLTYFNGLNHTVLNEPLLKGQGN